MHVRISRYSYGGLQGDLCAHAGVCPVHAQAALSSPGQAPTCRCMEAAGCWVKWTAGLQSPYFCMLTVIWNFILLFGECCWMSKAYSACTHVHNVVPTFLPGVTAISIQLKTNII